MVSCKAWLEAKATAAFLEREQEATIRTWAAKDTMERRIARRVDGARWTFAENCV